MQAEIRMFLLVPLLLAPAPGSSAPKVRRQSDLWGPWGSWGPCSRTCGGGISFRERPCYSQRTDGGSSCVGPVRSHRSCHTESCPTGARDFRAEQCAQFDGQDFQGKRYKWLPYYGAPNKCELNCIPKGENFYYKHREAVVDGTPCEPGKRDVCVEGSCRAVGCDHNLDSSKEEDKCLQCGGDGTTCYPVTGTFDANDLSRGYNQILIIPSGATSIRVEEAAASRNFLAVKSIRGEYYLNGHWTIGGAWALPVASTVLHYERGAEGDLAPERLLARGPTSEPLVIELLSQEPNPGVSYEYHLPLGSPRPGFHWSHGSWSDCSTECGGGVTSPAQCSAPLTTRSTLTTCASPSCGRLTTAPAALTPVRRPSGWKTGPWSPCSASCGGGSQSRSVYCVLSDGAGVQEATEEAECAGLPGKPPTMRPCNLQRCASWSAEPWGECSVSCGAGIRKRSVTCRGDEGSLLQATACSLEDRPPVSEPCAHEDCPPVSDQCSKSCSSGTRRRQVVCALGPPSRCGSLAQSKPGEVEPCNTQPCHLPPGVPSMQDMHSSPGDPRISLGPQAAPTSEIPEASGGPVKSSPRPKETPQEPRASTCQPQPPLFSNPHTDSLAWHPTTADSAPMGAVLTATLYLLGHSGRAVLGPHVSRAGTGAALMGCLWLRGPIKLAVQHLTAVIRPGEGRCREQWLPQAPKAHQPQAQQKEPSECQGSRFGCCYDNVASAAGPLGEGCVGQPGYAYPVRCLLPSAHGSCTDWAARWYFVPSVGQCNRFWYGGCHGNGNNFASEEECVNSCRGRQQEPPRPEPGASGQSTHRDGGGSGPGGQQEAGGHRTGATVQTRPLPSGGLWWRDREPGPGEEGHAQAFGERPLSQELGPSAPGLGGDAGRPAAPSHSSSYRISLAGSEPALVQAALGHLVRLFCQDDTSPEPHARWQKDGRPISSDRHKLQPDGSLVISPLRAEDTGTYSCGSSRPGRDSQKIQLRVTGLCPHPTPSGTGLRPHPTPRGLSWPQLGGDVAVLSEAEPRHFPQTRDPAQGHSPRESSLVGNAGGLGAVSSLQIRPTTRLLLDRNQPRVVDAHPGQRIRLTCRAEGFPPPAIEWQRDGQPLSSPRHQLQPDGSLVISHVALEDGGFYACVAFNGQDRDQRWVQLRVLGELTITELPSTMLVPEGDTARLLCVVTGESVNIRWSRNGLPVRADGHRVYQSPDGTLLIHNLQPRDEGSYTCSAYRGSQAVSRSTEVKVGPPALAAQSRDLSRECMDQPELANCDLILQAQLCGNEYYSSFCCASCSRFQPHARPVWQQG
ncbi:papilin isoform X4 [Prionailurus iriomotensis]